MTKRVEIPISQTKLLLILFGSFTFIIFGVFFIYNPSRFTSIIVSSELLISITGFASIVFFGVCFLWISKRLFGNKIGLIIDDSGITDQSGGLSVGHIHWKDITGVDVYQVQSTKMVVLKTRNPKKYIDRARNGLTKRALYLNYRLCGSPLVISSNSLKISHNELKELISISLAKWRLNTNG